MPGSLQGSSEGSRAATIDVEVKEPSCVSQDGEVPLIRLLGLLAGGSAEGESALVVCILFHRDGLPRGQTKQGSLPVGCPAPFPEPVPDGNREVAGERQLGFEVSVHEMHGAIDSFPCVQRGRAQGLLLGTT